MILLTTLFDVIEWRPRSYDATSIPHIGITYVLLGAGVLQSRLGFSPQEQMRHREKEKNQEWSLDSAFVVSFLLNDLCVMQIICTQTDTNVF